MKTAVLILTILVAALPSAARTITVDDDGPADFNNIQAAIDDTHNSDAGQLQPTHEKTRASPWKSRHDYLQTRAQEIQSGTIERFLRFVGFSQN